MNKKSILAVMIIASFLSPFMASSVTVALPAIAQSFHFNAIALSWISTAYLLATAIFLIPCGRLADIYGRRRVFLYGLWIYSIASLGAGFSFSGSILIISRILQGVGAAMTLSTSTAILSVIFSPGERGKAFGYNVAAVYAGLSLGPFIGGFVVQQLGWHALFLINFPIGLFLLFLTQRAIAREWAEAKGESFDFIGSIIYGFTLLCLMGGFSLLPKAIGGTLISISVAGALFFIWWEKRVRCPVTDIQLFRENKVFSFSSLAALIHYSATATVAFLLSLYLQYIRGMTPQEAGVILIAQPIIQAIISPFAGKLSDTFEPQIVASIGMGITSVALGALAFLTPATRISFIVITLTFLGLGFALFLPLTQMQSCRQLKKSSMVLLHQH